MLLSLSKLVAIQALMSSLALAITPPRQPRQPTGSGNQLLSYKETVYWPIFQPFLRSAQWVSNGADGQYVAYNRDLDVVLRNVATNDTKILVLSNELPEDMVDFWLSHDQQTLLVSSNVTAQHRHSYLSDYFVFDIPSGKKLPVVDDQAGDIQYAELAPIGNCIVFVRGNNLYLRDGDANIHQITTNGGPDMFNGVPDWVHEEEILEGRSALWFSPDAKYIAFLSFNETGVRTYTIPNYMADQEVAPTYPKEVQLRYPKVGSKNPVVQFNIVDVQTKASRVVPIEAFPADEAIIGEVTWVTDGHSCVVYRVFNRVQDKDKHVAVNPEAENSKVIRQRDGTDGWLENSRAIRYVGKLENNSNKTHYVDLSDASGWQHIYLYPVDGGEPTQLTSGDWEVASILYVDLNLGLVYYSATTHHSTERHIYSVSYVTKKVVSLVDDNIPAVFSATFSPNGTYYILSYMGPDIPYQELYASNGTRPMRTISTNNHLYERFSRYRLPNITYFQLKHPEGFSLNVRQILPPNFNSTKLYPVLFNPYGAPNSQSVDKTFQTPKWNAYIASDPTLEFITYVVDNRGTGFKGRKFRSAITGRLGLLEAEDQIWAAKQLIAQNKFIDVRHVGILGSSFGGYLAAKTIEANSGVFTFGLSAAPVSDWRFYDSMYAERYMKELDDNATGYDETAVRNSAGFKTLRGAFSIMHGTGDDNVHYQNTAALMDLLVRGDVPPDTLKMMAFTDIDHSIYLHGGNAYGYKFLTASLWDELQQKQGELHQWSKKSGTKSEEVLNRVL